MNNNDYHDKLKYMSILLWEYEKEIKELKKQIEEKNKLIEDLKAEIRLSDMELKDLTQIVNNSKSVEYMTKIFEKIQKLSYENKELNDIYNMTVNLYDYEYTM